MPPVGFEPAISAHEGPLAHDLDRAATGTGPIRKRWQLARERGEREREEQWRTEGGLGCSNPPPEILKALQNHAKLNPNCENC